MAVALCGYARFTEGIDILVSASPDNQRKLSTALGEFDTGLGKELTPEDYAITPGCIRLNEPSLTIDIFTLMNGQTFEMAAANARTEDLPEIGRITHLSRAQLVAAKRGSARGKDRLDVAELTALDKPTPVASPLFGWTKKIHHWFFPARQTVTISETAEKPPPPTPTPDEANQSGHNTGRER
ncbi:MAG: hypothetical protein LBK76_10335 [Verrucomicrobiales bacterium]|nr:hypothetical protein [Verrucomicrobiales bacterium]